MSNQTLIVDDRRGLIFTIDRERENVYQVESKHWATAAHRWSHQEIPPEIHAKIAELKQNGRPGAFAQLAGGDGVYVICEENIKPLPELAGDDFVIGPPAESSSGRQLSPYDIVICTKGGTIRADNGDTFETGPGEYYVIDCHAWGRFIVDQAMRPHDVEITKEILLLLEDLHGKNFLSMTPDKSEALPPGMAPPVSADMSINCYVLNLARFKR